MLNAIERFYDRLWQAPKRFGRWAVYSPNRALTAMSLSALVIIVLGFGGHRLAGAFGGDSGVRVRHRHVTLNFPTSTPTTTETPTSSPTDDGDEERIIAAVNPTIKAQARDFTQLWLAGRTAKTTTDWLATMRGYTDPSLRAELATTNRAAIPAAKVRKVEITEPGDYAATVRVTLSRGPALIENVAYDGAAWLVNGLAPETP